MKVKIQIFTVLLMGTISIGGAQANEINLQERLAEKGLSERLDILDTACSEAAEYHAGKKSVKRTQKKHCA